MILRICTKSSNSPERPWRQWRSRYAIHAGRNLPDKEFRYLRTVRVTAAVYQSLKSKPKPFLFTFWHRAGVRPYTSSCDLAESCVFTEQSLLPILCHPAGGAGSPLSLSYGVNLPSSFRGVVPNVWVFYTCPPGSVWVRFWKGPPWRPPRGGEVHPPGGAASPTHLECELRFSSTRLSWTVLEAGSPAADGPFCGTLTPGTFDEKGSHLFVCYSC